MTLLELKETIDRLLLVSPEIKDMEVFYRKDLRSPLEFDKEFKIEYNHIHTIMKGNIDINPGDGVNIEGYNSILLT